MGRGPALIDYEKRIIDGLITQNLTHQEIATEIHRSRNAVSTYLRKKTTNRRSKRLSRPKKMSDRTVRVLVNVAKNPGMTARKVTTQTGVNFSLRTVQRTL